MANFTDQLTKGAVAGFAATGPMTLFAELAHPALPEHERDPLPPRHITANLAEAAGVRDHLSEQDEQALTMVNHFGFGTTMGALYGTFAQRLPGPPLVGGISYGLAVWAASYLGWVPAAGLYRSPKNEPAPRHALLIAAHAVWGAALAATFAELDRRRADPSSQAFHKRGAAV
jgi:uncharacterized membrane protein YagU involved in acid resistance